VTYELICIAIFVAGIAAFVANKVAAWRFDRAVRPGVRRARATLLPEPRFTAASVKRAVAEMNDLHARRN
jgi:hypothetical protein